MRDGRRETGPRVVRVCASGRAWGLSPRLEDGLGGGGRVRHPPDRGEDGHREVSGGPGGRTDTDAGQLGITGAGAHGNRGALSLSLPTACPLPTACRRATRASPDTRHLSVDRLNSRRTSSSWKANMGTAVRPPLLPGRPISEKNPGFLGAASTGKNGRASCASGEGSGGRGWSGVQGVRGVWDRVKGGGQGGRDGHIKGRERGGGPARGGSRRGTRA